MCIFEKINSIFIQNHVRVCILPLFIRISSVFSRFFQVYDNSMPTYLPKWIWKQCKTILTDDSQMNQFNVIKLTTCVCIDAHEMFGVGVSVSRFRKWRISFSILSLSFWMQHSCGVCTVSGLFSCYIHTIHCRRIEWCLGKSLYRQ